ncbi:SDR family NAD(P)-dependent oxidoreductase [Kangiella koreensis]|uniref:Short-chain dehydrogenase/reductase SDR n=1 Tax=Kangiella koreensis (strain DSM 16069 / JCM 12317 / KCTC 12182 / SW-125) TaxID=523791 RepID=C7RAZ5_KANKD|nr:SDR family NAD(P)-dependent oxidoreductase [Kangiella koreensis]ACV26437.1 short-chain dehydrogenase/reductase SDR [Kangiella koreensis DSM 16069]
MGIAIIFGANGGIGQEFVKQALERYAVVFACSRPKKATPDSSKLPDIKTLDNGLVKVELNPHDEEQLQRFAQHVREQYGHVDLIINAIGILHDSKELQPEKKIEDFNLDNFIEMMTVNASATALIAKHFIKLLKQSDAQPAILASLSARVGSISDNRLGGWYSYRASKAALNQIIKTLSIEVARRNKNTAVIALHPGTTDTKLSKPFQQNVKPGKLFSPEYSVRKLFEIIDNLFLEDNGKFFAWDGSTIEW